MAARAVSPPGKRSSASSDRRIVLWIVAAVAVIALFFIVFGPAQEQNDPRPTIYNSGSQGIKAAYLLLSEMGYKSERWDSPLSQLRNADAEHSTLIIAEPILPIKELKPVQAEIAEFLKRGGRVVATGPFGAILLPGGRTESPTRLYKGLCFTEPEGPGALARAGEVSIAVPVRWSAEGPQYQVEQRCGTDAVVVRYRVGQGEAIWWSSPMPMTNTGLTSDANLKLLLASIGPSSRTVLFDEYLHEERESLLDPLQGLPWWPAAFQCLAVAALLLLARSLRSGPLRTPARVPRTSPVEFAQSMGRLYEKAGASGAATEAARGRLLEFLRDQCGIPREILRAEPPAISEALSERFGGDWTELEHHLDQAERASQVTLAPKTALKLVQLLEADHRRLHQHIQSHAHTSMAGR